MNQITEQQIINSALWAALGDAMGFPTELVTEDGLKRRIGQSRIEHTAEWSRLVGGKFGTPVTLGAGTYSDDTQLRLSTARSIRSDGYFDIETFSKIELPVWLSYCLGAGRGSKVGASALGQRNVAWFSNFFDQKDTSYINGGGNGAAMRIQPHVWASANLNDSTSYLPDVVRNTLCTHGHPRGIAGAVIHSACLAAVLSDREIPHPKQWADLGLYIDIAAKFIKEDSELGTFWLPTWCDRSGEDFLKAMQRVRGEWEADVEKFLRFAEKNSEISYDEVLDVLGAKIPEQRGSGIKSALFSLIAAWIYREKNPAEAIKTIANCLGSDTDTIGTMAGALLGALQPDVHPDEAIQDVDYITSGATRLYQISRGNSQESFQYPDLLKWLPPRSQSDSVGMIGNRLAVAGLAFADPVGDVFKSAKGDHVWQWLRLDFGQTILCKQRIPLPELSKSAYPASVRTSEDYSTRGQLNSPTQKSSGDLFQENAFQMSSPSTTTSTLRENSSAFRGEMREVAKQDKNKSPIPANSDRNVGYHPNLDELTDKAIRSGFDPKIIGIDLLSFAERPNGIELAIAYTAIIVKARAARLRANKN